MGLTSSHSIPNIMLPGVAICEIWVPCDFAQPFVGTVTHPKRSDALRSGPTKALFHGSALGMSP